MLKKLLNTLFLLVISTALNFLILFQGAIDVIALSNPLAGKPLGFDDMLPYMSEEQPIYHSGEGNDEDNSLELFVNGLNNDTKFATFSAETTVFLDTLAKSTENLALATLTSPKVLAIASNELLTCSADKPKAFALIVLAFNAKPILRFAFTPPPNS